MNTFKKILLAFLLALTFTSSYKGDIITKIPFCFDNWGEFYQAREWKTRDNRRQCRHAAEYFWRITGYRGTLLNCKVAFNGGLDHALVYLDGLYYDPDLDRVSNKLSGIYTVYQRIEKKEDLPEGYLDYDY